LSIVIEEAELSENTKVLKILRRKARSREKDILTFSSIGDRSK
jgi:hypothetical protein